MKQFSFVFALIFSVAQATSALSTESRFYGDSSKIKSNAPRFYKSKIGNSACSAYFPLENPRFDVSYSEDNSTVTTWDSIVGTHSFALIHVSLSSVIDDSLTRQDMLVSYLDFLKENFAVKQSAGYGFGHTLSSDAKTQGIIDFWLDDENTEYSIKAWINEKYITVFFVYGEGEYEYQTVKELFFNGLRYN